MFQGKKAKSNLMATSISFMKRGSLKSNQWERHFEALSQHGKIFQKLTFCVVILDLDPT